MDISRPHDTFFRLVVSKVSRAMELICHQIPASVSAHLLFETMTSEPDTFVDSHLKNLYSDALFKVQTRTGSSAYLYLLIDHKSSPDADVDQQLLRYMNRIWERWITNNPGSMLPPIIGIVPLSWKSSVEHCDRFSIAV